MLLVESATKEVSLRQKTLVVLDRAATIHFLTIQYISRYRCYDTIHDTILNAGCNSAFPQTQEDIFQQRAYFTCRSWRLCQLANKLDLCSVGMNWCCHLEKYMLDRKDAKLYVARMELLSLSLINSSIEELGLA